MMLSQSLPKQITDWACTAKTFLDVKLKNLMMTALKTFQMIAIAPHQHHQINKPFKKIFNPYKLKSQSNLNLPSVKKRKQCVKQKVKKRNNHAKQKTV